MLKFFLSYGKEKKNNKVILRFVTSYEMDKKIIQQIESRLKMLKKKI